jgi:hypothetical protein
MDPNTPPHIRQLDVLVTYRLNCSYFYFPSLQYALRNVVPSRLFELCNLPDQPSLSHFLWRVPNICNCSWMSKVRKFVCLGFRIFVITESRATVSTFRYWFRRTVLRPRGWQSASPTLLLVYWLLPARSCITWGWLLLCLMKWVSCPITVVFCA